MSWKMEIEARESRWVIFAGEGEGKGCWVWVMGYGGLLDDGSGGDGRLLVDE